MQLGKLQREIISRTAMGVVAAGLLYGGVKCMLLVRAFMAEAVASRSDRSSGAGLPLLVGIVLLVIGGVFALAAITPSSVFARIMGPPTNTTLWENSEPADKSWWWWLPW